jgi:hypothetical protein
MATGGVLSVEVATEAAMPATVSATASAFVRKLHQVTPYLAVLSSAAALYLLRGNWVG